MMLSKPPITKNTEKRGYQGCGAPLVSPFFGLICAVLLAGCALSEDINKTGEEAGITQGTESTQPSATVPPTQVVASLEADTVPEADSPIPTPVPDPLVIDFPEPEPPPVSAWRPPLYAIPWAPTPTIISTSPVLLRLTKSTGLQQIIVMAVCSLKMSFIREWIFRHP